MNLSTSTVGASTHEHGSTSQTANNSQPSTSGMIKTTRPSCKRSRKSRLLDDSSDEESFDWQIQDESSDEDWETYRKKKLEEKQNEETQIKVQKELKEINKQVGAFVIVNYDNDRYPGVIESFDETGATVSAMIKSMTNWKWPVKKDELFYKWEEIVGGIDPPKMLNKRGFFSVPELSESDVDI